MRGSAKILEWLVLHKLSYHEWAKSVDALGEPIVSGARPANEAAVSIGRESPRVGAAHDQ